MWVESFHEENVVDDTTNYAKQYSNQSPLHRGEMASQRKLLEMKISILEEQKSQLFMKVDRHLNKVLSLGQSYLSGVETGHGLSFRQLCHLVDDAALQVVEKCAEIPDELDLSPSQGEPVTSQEKPENRLKAETQSVTSDGANPTGSVNAEVVALKEAVHVLASRIDILEQRSKQDNSSSDGSQTLVEAQTIQNSETETRLMEIHSKHKILQDNQVKTLEIKVSDIQSKLEVQRNLLCEEIKKQERQIKQLNDVLQPLVMDIGEMQENVTNLREQVKTAESCAAEKKNLEALEQKFNSLDSTVKDLSKILEGHGFHKVNQTVKELAKKVEDNEGSIVTLTNSRKRDFSTLQAIQYKMAIVESDKKEAVDKVTKLCQKTDNQYQMVCKIVAKRLTALERLRDIFNTNLRTRQDNMRKADIIAQQVTSIIRRLDRLETDQVEEPVGFFGSFPSIYKPFNDRVINHFQNEMPQYGKLLTPKSGVFRAPKAGLYAAFVCILLDNQGQVILEIMKHENVFQNSDSDVCVATVDDANSKLVLVHMDAGNELYVKVKLVKNHPVMDVGTSFTCFRIR